MMKHVYYSTGIKLVCVCIDIIDEVTYDINSVKNRIIYIIIGVKRLSVTVGIQQIFTLLQNNIPF